MICNKCGQQNNDDSMFCYSCGALIEKTQQSNANQASQQGGRNYQSSQAPAYAEPVAASEPAYTAPTAPEPAYTAPSAPTATYTAPSATTPTYTAPSAPAYATPPVYSAPSATSEAKPGIGFSIAGMICGIGAILSLYIGMIPGALGIIFGALAKKKGATNGMATAGIICGAIGIVLSLVWIVVCIAVFEEASSYYSYPSYYYY